MNYPEFIDDLKKSADVIDLILDGVSQHDSEYKENKERWSLLEIVGHLLDIEKIDFRYEFEIIIADKEIPWPTFDIEELRVTNKYNEMNFIDQKKEFLSERNKSLEWLKALKNPELDKEHYQKKVNGIKIKAGDVLASWVAHDLYHIRQIALVKWFVLNKRIVPYSSQYSGFEYL